MEFKDMLKYLRSRAGLSQRELAARLKIAPSTVSMYEVGKREPDFETEELIADFFNVDLNTLRGKDPETPPTPSPALSTGEQELLQDYDALNDEGQAKVREYTADLVASGRYEKDAEEPSTGYGTGTGA